MTQEKESKSNEVEELRTIFSKEEIRNTVKAFTLAFFRGSIVLEYDNAQTIMTIEEKKGKKISYEEARKQEIKMKQTGIDNMMIVSGSMESTNIELDNAIKKIFNEILFLRAGHRITGTFLEFDIEKRMDQMDERISATNNVVQEFVNWYIETEKGHDKGLS